MVPVESITKCDGDGRVVHYKVHGCKLKKGGIPIGES